MPKYYVQSGTFRSVVTAESASKAAVWAVHQVMQQILPIETPTGPPSGVHDEPPRVTALDARVRVNERGFDRADAQQWKTIEVIGQWNQMIETLDRLDEMLHRL